MESKLALVDAIELIKEKLTDKEYKDILELLGKIKVKKSFNTDDDSTDSGPEFDSTDSESVESATCVRFFDGYCVRDINPNHLDFSFSCISSQLATFICIPENVFVTRSHVTYFIMKYIADNQLRSWGTYIINLNKPGGKQLRELLHVPHDAELTFYNMSNYLDRHFVSS